MFLHIVDLALASFWTVLDFRGSFVDHTQSFSQSKFWPLTSYLAIKYSKKVVPKVTAGLRLNQVLFIRWSGKASICYKTG